MNSQVSMRAHIRTSIVISRGRRKVIDSASEKCDIKFFHHKISATQHPGELRYAKSFRNVTSK